MAAVKDFSFDSTAGEVLGIGGPNGAGKTTLFELISGLNPADKGQILLEGQEIQSLAPHAICHMGIARMFQSNAGFDTLSARQNVLIAAAYGRNRRPHSGLSSMTPTSAARRMRPSIRRLPPLAERPGPQPAGAGPQAPDDRQRTRHEAEDPDDGRTRGRPEPGGDRPPDGLVRKLISAGVTIMLIEHVMRFLVQLSTRVMIMHHGEKIYEGTPGGLAHDETVTRVYLGERMSKRIAALARRAAMSEALLEIRNVEAGYGGQKVLRGISFDVPKGGMVTLIGPNGHGKTTLLRVISGLVKPWGGDILLDGEKINGRAPIQSWKHGIVHIPQGDLLFADMTVYDNLMMGAYPKAAYATAGDRLAASSSCCRGWRSAATRWPARCPGASAACSPSAAASWPMASSSSSTSRRSASHRW